MFSAEYLSEVQEATDDALWAGAKTFSGLARGNVFYELSRRAYAKDDCHSAVGLSETAISEFLALGDSCPWIDLIDAYTLNAMNAMALNQYDDAVFAIEKSVNYLRRYHPDALSNNLSLFGLFLQLAERYEEALVPFEELMTISDLDEDKPSLIYALTHLAEIYIKLERFDKANENLDRLVPLVKGEQEAELVISVYETYGDLCVKRLEYEKAIGFYEKAYDLNQTAGYYRDSYFNKFEIGQAWFNLANFKKSILAYKDALRGMRALIPRELGGIVEIEEGLVRTLARSSWRDRQSAKKIKSRIARVRQLIDGDI
ncbi:MAG: tetratricopeptide repeat protein [Candidatus Nanopelagicales bacterium]